MDQRRDNNLQCHLGTHEMLAHERGWWEVKGIRWGKVKWLSTNGINKSNARSSTTHYNITKKFQKEAPQDVEQPM